jgi:ABC-2 type transport system ATP-binding protein
MIDVKDLEVVYSDGTRAVDGVSFEVKEGEFFGFLGPNGAGKSTTIKVLTTLLRKTSGRVIVAGFDLDESPQEIRKAIGCLSQETILDVDLTGRENLRFQGRMQQMHGTLLEDRVTELLKLVQLEEAADKPAGRYSGGMKKRLDLATSLIHRPKLLFLDEPTTGLDPQSRVSIWDYLEELNKGEGVTVFLTTQNMEEADRLCRDLRIIDRGRIIAAGSPPELKEALGGDAISISYRRETDPHERTRAKELLMTIKGVTGAVEAEDSVIAYAKNAGELITEIATALDRNNLRPASMTVSSPTLDDVFLKVTGRRIRSEELGAKEQEPFLM